MNSPSPPNSALRMPRMKVMSKETESWNMPIWPGCTMIDWPGGRS
jgi:hypothetical protein